MGEHVTEPVRIGIVGAGNRGRNHANRYDRIPGVEVVAVADVDVPKARALAEEKGAESYPDHEEMLADADLDGANVCVHATLHADIAVDLLDAGVHAFCEKPMAGSYADARRMADAADRTGNLLGVQNQLLYTTETRAARALVEAGELGKVYHGVAARSPGFALDASGDPEEVPLGARRRGVPYVDGYGSPAFVQADKAGGGVVLDLGSYTVGQLLYLMADAGERSADARSRDAGSAALDPPTVERVRGETFQTVPERFDAESESDAGGESDDEEGTDDEEEADDGRGTDDGTSEYARRIAESDYDVEDVALAFVTFADGSVLSVRTSWSRYAEEEASALVGTEGGVQLDPFEFYSTVGDVEMRASADLEEYLFRTHYLDGERGEAAYNAGLWADPLYHWVESLTGRAESQTGQTGPLPTADLALESMVVLEGIYRSSELGREVTREEIVEEAGNAASEDAGRTAGDRE